MTFIFRHLKSHFQNENWLFFIIITLFAILSVVLNYSFNIRKEYVSYIKNDNIKYLEILLFMLFPLATGSIIYHFTKTKNSLQIATKKFWLKIGIIALLYTLSVGITPYYNHIQEISSGADRRFLSVSFTFTIRSLIIIAGLAFLKPFSIKMDGFYFLTPKIKNLKDIRILLLLVILVIAIASFSSSFHKYYPMFYTTRETVLGMPYFYCYIIYSLSYGLYLIATELFFRGFILGFLYRHIGRFAIHISSILYCYVHFAKPPAEALTSYFGGIILCIIALKTRSVWTGVALHIAIAWSMDAFSLIQRTILQN